MTSKNMRSNKRLKALIPDLIAGGRYQSVRELINDGPRLIEEGKIDIEILVWPEILGPRLEAADRGETKWIEMDEFFREFDEFRERFKRDDTCRALYPHELSDELKTELEKGYKGEERPDLNHLMK